MADTSTPVAPEQGNSTNSQEDEISPEKLEAIFEEASRPRTPADEEREIEELLASLSSEPSEQANSLSSKLSEIRRRLKLPDSPSDVEPTVVKPSLLESITSKEDEPKPRSWSQPTRLPEWDHSSPMLIALLENGDIPYVPEIEPRQIEPYEDPAVRQFLEEIDKMNLDAFARATGEVNSATESPRSESPGDVEIGKKSQGHSVSSSAECHKTSENLGSSRSSWHDKTSENPAKRGTLRHAKNPHKMAVSSNTGRSKRARPTVSRQLAEKKWERREDEDRALIYQFTLDVLGESHPFTVDIGHDLWDEARACKKALSTWLNERLSYHLEPLERILGYRVPYYFAIEISRTGVLHIHGAIGVNSNFLPEVYRALHKVAGSSETGAHKYFVDVGDFDELEQYGGYSGSLGWAAYSAKVCKRTAKLGVGAPLVCRRELNQAARGHFRELLEELILRNTAESKGRPAPERESPVEDEAEALLLSIPSAILWPPDLSGRSCMRAGLDG